MNRIAITTSSFARFDEDPLERLRARGFSVILNPHGRTLKPEELVEVAAGCPAVIAGTENYTDDVLARLPELRLISRCGAGLDSLDLDACARRGIEVVSTPDAPAKAVAELVLGLTLDLLRRLSAMDRAVRQGTWKKQMGGLLAEKNFGIIGMGRIGRRVARLAGAFEAKVWYADPMVDGVPEGRKAELSALLEYCDVISLHTPLTPDSRHLIGREALARMKPGAILINCARGGLVDEAALYEALKSGKIAGAALDVFEEEPYRGPLAEFEQVVLTPHIGSYARETRIQMECEAVENLIQHWQHIQQEISP